MRIARLGLVKHIGVKKFDKGVKSFFFLFFSHLNIACPLACNQSVRKLSNAHHWRNFPTLMCLNNLFLVSKTFKQMPHRHTPGARWARNTHQTQDQPFLASIAICSLGTRASPGVTCTFIAAASLGSTPAWAKICALSASRCFLRAFLDSFWLSSN